MTSLRNNHGVTLLELIISLALSGLLFAMITQMIGNHFHVLEKQRDNVEEVQLARALLSRISQDIKSAVQYNGVDVEAALGDVDIAGALDIASGAGVGMEDLLGAADSLLTSEDTSTSYDFETTFPTSLGMYGDQATLRLDVSRIPRQEEYRAMYDPTEIGVLQDIPSDVKLISYYCRALNVETDASAQDVFNDDPTVPGLIRGQLSRAITSYAMNNGNYQSVQNADKLLAPEVIALEFQYFDGYQWLQYWDSEEFEGLPLAVKIRMTMRSNSPYSSGGVLDAFYGNTTDSDGSMAVTYQKIVKLPVGKIRPLEQEDGGLQNLGL
ncbi:MAG: hypothetical protein CMJ76_01620 [Planctomycetaceae bacterium]|nr:hypothetical protein [Planctomycetaceae bacterium]